MNKQTISILLNKEIKQINIYFHLKIKKKKSIDLPLLINFINHATIKFNISKYYFKRFWQNKPKKKEFISLHLETTLSFNLLLGSTYQRNICSILNFKFIDI